MPEFHLKRGAPILVPVRLRGPRACVILSMALDTGAALTIIAPETAMLLGYDPARARKRVELVTGSGIEIVPTLSVKKVECLGRGVAGLTVACHALPPESRLHGLLGLNFLSQFNLHLRFLDGRIELTRS